MLEVSRESLAPRRSTQTPKVMVAFDFADTAEAALQVARGCVEATTDLEVVYVMSLPDPNAVWGEIDVEAMRERAFDAMHCFLEKVGYADAHTHVLIGRPERRLVDFAREHGVDLVIMHSHGRAGIERWLMGSVAETVVHAAPCPVLVIRPEESEDDRFV